MPSIGLGTWQMATLPGTPIVHSDYGSFLFAVGNGLKQLVPPQTCHPHTYMQVFLVLLCINVKKKKNCLKAELSCKFHTWMGLLWQSYSIHSCFGWLWSIVTKTMRILSVWENTSEQMPFLLSVKMWFCTSEFLSVLLLLLFVLTCSLWRCV